MGDWIDVYVVVGCVSLLYFYKCAIFANLAHILIVSAPLLALVNLPKLTLLPLIFPNSPINNLIPINNLMLTNIRKISSPNMRMYFVIRLWWTLPWLRILTMLGLIICIINIVDVWAVGGDLMRGLGLTKIFCIFCCDCGWWFCGFLGLLHWVFFITNNLYSLHLRHW